MPNYIGKREDEAFRQMNDQNVSEREKTRLLDHIIHPALTKLVDNLIWKYGQTTDDNVRILRDDCIAHLVYRISEYDYNKGNNSFSFFNVCAKHFILQYIERKKRFSPIVQVYRKDTNDNANGSDENTLKSNTVSDIFIDNSYETAGEENDQDFFSYLQAELCKIIVNCQDRKEKEFLRNVVTILEDKDKFNVVSKKLFYASIHGMSIIKPRELKKYVSSLKEHYSVIKERYYSIR